eukprot:TRINITY_DN2737_c0_g1_i2.p1 TRINITY_DN2737_c0_g1~~TRINITY_DN2737_c0_g1_i2.p1  ORF type:complete len:164 (+),score=12.51 TRINITY_DN2737_c0_g1_i2:63-494(+)
MDHHCMWMNNCVGAYNQKHFLLFLVYTVLHCGFAAIAVVLCFTLQYVALFMEDLPPSHSQDRADQGPKPLAACLVLLLAAYFGKMSVSLIKDQVQSLRRNQTFIELLQGTSGEPRSFYESLEEVMDCPPSWRWLLPLPRRLIN